MQVFRLLFAGLLLTLSAAAPAFADKGLPYFVNAESLAMPGFSGPKTYVLIPASDQLTEDELQYQYYVPYLVAALKSKELALAQGDQKPDLVIFVDYGVGDPKDEVRTRRFPIFGQTGVSGSTTTGYVSPYGRTFSSTTTFTPTFGVTGFSSETQKFTTYTKRITFEAYYADTVAEGEKPRPAFRTNIFEFGESPDLRRAVPAMLASSLQHIGTTTPGMVQRGVRENHSIVKKFKKSVTTQ